MIEKFYIFCFDKNIFNLKNLENAQHYYYGKK
jgi:hypothetical protein